MKSRFISGIPSSVEIKAVGKFQNSSPVRYGKGDTLRLGVGCAMGGGLGDFTLVDDGKDVSKTFDCPRDAEVDSDVDTADSGLGGGHEWQRLLRVHQVLLSLSSARDITPKKGAEQATSFIPHDEAISWACLSALFALSGSPSACNPIASSMKAWILKMSSAYSWVKSKSSER